MKRLKRYKHFKKNRNGVGRVSNGTYKWNSISSYSDINAQIGAVSINTMKFEDLDNYLTEYHKVEIMDILQECEDAGLNVEVQERPPQSVFTNGLMYGVVVFITGYNLPKSKKVKFLSVKEQVLNLITYMESEGFEKINLKILPKDTENVDFINLSFTKFVKIKNESYQEYKSTFTHDGIEYDLNKLFEFSELLPVELFDIDDLDWVLDHSTIDNNRVENADVNVPILITQYNGKYVVLDGAHRLTKAKKLGKEKIKVKIVPHPMGILPWPTWAKYL